MIDSFKRALCCALPLFILSCSTPCREWYFQQIVTDNPCFNSGRIILDAESSTSQFEVELSRSSLGLRMYINILLFEACPWSKNPALTCVDVILDNGKAIKIYPFILKGGQKLLLSEDATAYLLEKLVNGESFTIVMGRRKSKVIPDNFIVCYEQLMALPIVDR
jgi:hypothetical protein